MHPIYASLKLSTLIYDIRTFSKPLLIFGLILNKSLLIILTKRITSSFVLLTNWVIVCWSFRLAFVITIFQQTQNTGCHKTFKKFKTRINFLIKIRNVLRIHIISWNYLCYIPRKNNWYRSGQIIKGVKIPIWFDEI